MKTLFVAWLIFAAIDIASVVLFVFAALIFNGPISRWRAARKAATARQRSFSWPK